MESKSQLDRILDSLEYTPVDVNPNKDGIPYATHEGILNLGEISIRVIVLNTGQRIIPESELSKIF